LQQRRKCSFLSFLIGPWALADTFFNLYSGDDVYLIVPPIFDHETEATSKEVLSAGWGYAEIVKKDPLKKEPPAKWSKPSDKLADAGVVAIVTVRIAVKHIAWHRRGDYFATVSPEGNLPLPPTHALLQS